MNIDTTAFPLSVREAFDFYETGGAGAGHYSADDWARLATAYSLVEGSSVLDVGVGNGAFLHILAFSRRFSSVQGIDIRPHSKLIVPAGVEFQTMNVSKLAFPDASFDTVMCMEVLEHLDDETFEAGLRELRRVAARRLVLTVPFEEPHPLWWHDKPGGHRQQFLRDRITRVFPKARARMQRRYGVNWIFLVEGDQANAGLSDLESAFALR